MIYTDEGFDHSEPPSTSLLIWSDIAVSIQAGSAVVVVVVDDDDDDDDDVIKSHAMITFLFRRAVRPSKTGSDGEARTCSGEIREKSKCLFSNSQLIC